MPAPESGSRSSEADPDLGSIVVRVPVLRYRPVDDRFTVGPYPSRLDVLHNDFGYPDRTRLELLDSRGRPVTVLALPTLGTLRVIEGYVLVDPTPRATGAATFSFRAASANGDLRASRASITFVSRVIQAQDDVASLAARAPGEVVIDIAANDLMLVAGAVRACPPALSAQPFRPADPQPVVLPESERPTTECAPPKALTTRDGQWRVDDGVLVFRPSDSFRGTAIVHYRQATDFPFDLGTAAVQVRSGGQGDTRVLGQELQRPGSEPARQPGGGSGNANRAPDPSWLLPLLFLVPPLVAFGLPELRLRRQARQARAAAIWGLPSGTPKVGNSSTLPQDE